MTPSLHHAGVTVTDLERSVEFYGRVFGAEVEMRLDARGDDVAALHGLSEADFSMAMMRIGDACIELFEFRAPTDSRRRDVRPQDPGLFHHVAITVDDVRAMHDELVAEGIEFTRPPLQVNEDVDGEYVIAFFSDPDGNRIELVQTP